METRRDFKYNFNFQTKLTMSLYTSHLDVVLTHWQRQTSNVQKRDVFVIRLWRHGQRQTSKMAPHKVTYSWVDFDVVLPHWRRQTSQMAKKWLIRTARRQDSTLKRRNRSFLERIRPTATEEIVQKMKRMAPSFRIPFDSRISLKLAQATIESSLRRTQLQSTAMQYWRTT